MAKPARGGRGPVGKSKKPGGRESRRKDRRADMAGLPVRRAAVHILALILRHSEPMDRAFSNPDAEKVMTGMEHRDRALVRLLITTALRRKGQIDDALGRFLEKPLPKRSGYLKEILAVAAAQILFLNTPPHAAINIAVRQCQMDRRAQHMDKLCNALLRRLSERGPELLADQDACVINTPDWMWQRWCRFFGVDGARDIAAMHLTAPALDLSVKSEPGAWASKLDGTLLPTGSIRLAGGGRIEQLPGYDEGEWWVQDVTATLPPKMLGDVRGLDVADLCAAPGGKTAMLLTGGAHVTAVDSSHMRLRRLRENLDRLKLEAKLVEADILSWQTDRRFDAVLLDAPCSATGTIRRHPDILHIKTLRDVEELSRLQFEMIRKAAVLLKEGGRLVFCTCSLEEEEGEAHLARIADEIPELRQEKISAAAFGFDEEWISSSGSLRTLPSHMQCEPPQISGMDGFFAAKFVKMDARIS